MKKADVMKLYRMEELIPVVGQLAQEFTAKESSSVTYERARQLMEAVIYCMAHADEKENLPVGERRPDAGQMYLRGLDCVVEKVRQTQEKYNKLMCFFDHYGNENYRDTVEKALPGFFMYYDAKFAPTETIITMDYPVFGLAMDLEGIDRIRQYLDAIWEEQFYLLLFSREDVIRALHSFHPRYEREFFNLKEIVQQYHGTGNLGNMAWDMLTEIDESGHLG